MIVHIIDANNYIRRAFERGETITQMINQNPAELHIWVFDGIGAKKPRLKLYPEYKAKRNVQAAIDNGFYDFLRTVEREFLPYCGNTLVIKKDGLEADDIIAALTNTYKGTHPILIHSNDADFQALVCDTVKVTDRSKTLAHVEPKDIRLYKTLVGDSSDNIGGIEGFGKGKWDLLDEQDKAQWVQWFEGAFEDTPDWMGNMFPHKGLTKKPLEWMQVTQNQQLLQTYWKIVGFIPVNMAELGDKCTLVGTYNSFKLQETLNKYLWN